MLTYQKMKAGSSNVPGDQPPIRQKGTTERDSGLFHHGQLLWGIIAILVIGGATTLALLLLQLITAHP